MEYNAFSESLRQRYYTKMQNEIYGSQEISGRPSAVQLVKERTFSSSCMVLESIEAVSLSDLAVGTAIFFQNFQNSEFSRLYIDQMVLAKSNPEKFVFGLHPFYDKMTDKVRKYREFSQMANFLGKLMRTHVEQRPMVGNDIANAYVNLALQTLEYLRPVKYELETCVYGISTEGKPLGGPYPLPYSDVPGIEIQRELAQGKQYASQAEYFLELQRKYAASGIAIRAPFDIERMEQIQRVHINSVAALLPFINERTWHMAPSIPHNPKDAPLMNMTYAPVDLASIKQCLRLYHKPLPEEGVEIQFEDPTDALRGLALMEVTHEGKPYILHRLDDRAGRFCGYYDIQDGFLYSIMREATSPLLFHNLTALFLVLYASLALPNICLPDLNSIFEQGGQPLLVKSVTAHGKNDNFSPAASF